MARTVGMDSPLLKHDYDRRRKVVEREDEEEKPEGMFINQGLIDRLLKKKESPLGENYRQIGEDEYKVEGLPKDIPAGSLPFDIEEMMEDVRGRYKRGEAWDWDEKRIRKELEDRRERRELHETFPGRRLLS